MSVKIVDYKLRESFDGNQFYALVLQGGVEIITSQTGKQYLTAKRASIPSTFDEDGCKALIGSELPGNIEKVECEAYEFTNSDGGVVTLNFRYEYQELSKPTLNEVYAGQYPMNENLLAA
ncbi:MAG: hypothetical protein QM727_12555 [Niabella sp.]